MPVRKKARFTGRIANTIYSAALLAMLYDWPHQVYQKLGPRMGAVTAREQFIIQEVDDYARRLRLRLNPTFVIGSVPAAAGAFSGNAVIVVSPAMLDLAKFSDNDVRFILAHEVGHVARLDSYRFWTRWTDSGAAARELDADRIAVRLVGCDAMRETVARHWHEFLKGYQEEGDYHPHPERRLSEVCGQASSLSNDGRVRLHEQPIKLSLLSIKFSLREQNRHLSENMTYRLTLAATKRLIDAEPVRLVGIVARVI